MKELLNIVTRQFIYGWHGDQPESIQYHICDKGSHKYYDTLFPVFLVLDKASQPDLYWYNYSLPSYYE